MDLGGWAWRQGEDRCHAQVAPTRPEGRVASNDLDEVMVIAQKWEERFVDVPVGMTAINADALGASE
jgi:hypothetical protein